MKERLTIRYPSGEIAFQKCVGCPTPNCNICKFNERKTDLLINRVADYEDKIENGTLIELQCKEGDTIYEVIKGLPIQEWVVSVITIQRQYRGDIVFFAKRKSDGANWKFWGSQFGEKLFTTREEAEARLEELQK